MQKRIISLAIILTLSTQTHAALNCPSLSSISQQNLEGWIALDKNSDEPASREEIAEFEHSIESFSGAQWSAGYLFGYGRCDYNSANDVYLASGALPAFSPPTGKKWKWDNYKIVKLCNSDSPNECMF